MKSKRNFLSINFRALRACPRKRGSISPRRLIKSIRFRCSLNWPTSSSAPPLLNINEKRFLAPFSRRQKKASDDQIISSEERRAERAHDAQKTGGKIVPFSVIKNVVWISLKIICLEITNFSASSRALWISALFEFAFKLFEAIHD